MASRFFRRINMVIYIDLVLSDLQASLHRDDVQISLENLAGMSREGRCYLIASSRNLFLSLADSSRLSDITRTNFRRLEGLLTQWHSVGDSVFWKVLICCIDGQLEKIDEAGKVTLKIPLTWFFSHSNVRSPFLLTENLIDAKLIRKIAELVHFDGFAAPRNIALENVPGGGDTTAGVLEELMQEGERIGFCVVDSDRYRPDGAKGGTATKVVRLDGQSPLINILVLPERELENCFSWSFLYDLPCVNISEEDRAKMISLSDCDHYYYADLKEGTKLSSLFSRCPDDLAYWAQYQDSARHCAGACSQEKGKCGCLLTPKLSKKLLEDLNNCEEAAFSGRRLGDFSRGLIYALNMTISLGASPLPRRVS